ncbi:MAG: peptide chain release factor N(5)-glutamine methyltransferase [Candidatus Ancillula sp.]|jgi:release factor glutamine methyltransferase|nr:peptide chain release factor N(5)-glutamine methyltransferase [Candidatus Ancillula sp.]
MFPRSELRMIFDTLGEVDDTVIVNLEKQRELGVPLQYLLRSAHFYGLDLFIEEGVFIPRFETEVLVERVVQDCKCAQRSGHSGRLRIADLCAGTGAIGLKLATSLRNVDVTLVEIDDTAIRAIQKNVELYKSEIRALSNSVKIVQADVTEFSDEHCARTDMGENGAQSQSKYDVVVSNPPYIPSVEELQEEDITLPNDVLNEPALALFGGGEHGMLMPETVIRTAARVVSPGGKLYLEHYDDQAPEIAKILDNQGFRGVEHFNDLNGVPRFSKARVPIGSSGQAQG